MKRIKALFKRYREMWILVTPIIGVGISVIIVGQSLFPLLAGTLVIAVPAITTITWWKVNE